MSDTDGVIAAARKLCEPSEKESAKISAVADYAIQLVRRQVAGLDVVVGIEFGGSYAKGTWLRGAADIDIFVKLKPSVPEEKFEELGKQIGLDALEAFKPILRYSDHPYVEAIVKGIRINIVPCYEVTDGRWKSAADRSVFHTQYVNQHYDEEMRGQVRLLKRFFKTVGVYGAEIATEGFSGYVCEVLVLKYHSFVGVLQALAVIKEREVIAIEGYDTDIVSGFPGPLLIIDPIDSRRNLGTAISPESAAKSILAARAFLEKPAIEFFAAKPRQPRASEKLFQFILVVEFSHKLRPPDVIWGQLKRAMTAIAKQLEIAGFAVMRSDCITDEKNSAAFVFLLESMSLPVQLKRKGPEVFRASDSARFIEASIEKSGPKPALMWVDKDMRLALLTRRKATDARQFVRSLVKLAEASGIPKNLIEGKRVQIYRGDEKKRLKPLVFRAVSGLAATDRLAFRNRA